MASFSRLLMDLMHAVATFTAVPTGFKVMEQRLVIGSPNPIEGCEPSCRTRFDDGHFAELLQILTWESSVTNPAGAILDIRTSFAG